MPDDGRSISRNVAYLNILVHDVINLLCYETKSKINYSLNLKLKLRWNLETFDYQVSITKGIFFSFLTIALFYLLTNISWKFLKNVAMCQVFSQDTGFFWRVMLLETDYFFWAERATLHNEHALQVLFSFPTTDCQKIC